MFLLDSDMYLTEPTNLEELLGHSQVASVLQKRDTVEYLWPNFSVLSLPHRHMYRKLDFSPAVWVNHEDGTFHSLDSGGSTVVFLNQHSELRVASVRAGARCLEDKPRKDVCVFLEETLELERPSHCREAEVLSVNTDGAGCGVSLCEPVYFFHLGSAGSNWRGCPEDYLEARRDEWKAFLRRLVIQSRSSTA